MRRPLVIAAGLLVAALIVGGGGLALRPVEPAGPIYTVADITVGLRRHPRQWVGRAVAVRGVVSVFGLGLGPPPAPSWSGPLLLDPIPLVGRRYRLPLRISQATRTGAGQVQFMFNAPGTAPTLMLGGGAPPAPTPFDVVRRLVVSIAARLGGARRANIYSYSPPQPRVYRVRLLAPARCPAPLAPPCYTAVVR